MLAERLVSRNSSISTERATIFDSLDKILPVCPKRLNLHNAFISLFVIFQAISLKMSSLSVANPSTPRGAIFHSEEEVRSDSIYRF